MLIACWLAAALWLALVVTPWRPWSTRERIEPAGNDCDLADVTVLIPARDEASCIADTLRAVAAQGNVAGIVLVDDQSSDGTGEVARATGLDRLEVITGSAPAPGWSGKLWALEQARTQARSSLLLLLDADIELRPGTLAALHHKLKTENLALASVMAELHMGNAWEKLLLPPFIYFFKLIYPFALSNDPRSSIAAAAGGCVLLRAAALEEIGGFGAMHDAIIDDCTLARNIKQHGGHTWLGLSRAVRAIRPYGTLANIWNMVARTAFTQLHYSAALLLLCTTLLLLSFVVPLAALFGDGTQTAALTALAAMYLTYWPTVRYYDLPVAWVTTLPLAAALFLAMTWTSALRYWSGERSRWKDRSYE